MSLLGALNVGRSALMVSQAQIQTTGNNIANAGNPDYTRQVANVQSGPDQKLMQGVSIGSGLDLTSVQRQIDDALEGRLRSSISDDNAASTTKQWLDRVESVFNELGDQDISTQLSTFFNSWSKLADNPLDASQRSLVIQNGQSLASWVQNVRSDLSDVQKDVGGSIGALVKTADGLASQVADLNKQIATSETTGGMANSLRDQRDAVLKQLAGLVDIRTADGGNGMLNVFIGSEPLVTQGASRGLVASTTTDASGNSTVSVGFRKPDGGATVTGGQIGALVQLQTGQLKTTIGQLDSLAGNLIFELNKVYSGGQGADADGLQGFASVTATNAVADPNVALNDPASGLAFKPTNGSFVVSVYDSSTKQIVKSQLFSIDLDGLNGNDTTLASLQADLNASGIGVNASITGGKLTIASATPGQEVLFGQDTSGTLAALGINTFFTGTSAVDIGVNQAVAANPSLLAATGNLQPGGNSVAVAVNALQQQSLPSLGGQTLVSTYQDMINQAAVASSTAQNNADAASTVRQTLEAQRESLSGVSMDEEAVNLMKQQRAFQGAARLISAIDEMMKTVLSMAT